MDVSELLILHKNNGGIGSLGFWGKLKKPRFGIVGIDGNNKNNPILKKKSPNQMKFFSKLINAGSIFF
ncbi:MAG: hypothetical protein CM15mP47_0020 [Methanobacteriota archaeon]|nr:MAG: hypothetical protein CM15mP47_0020 [Euryarchaeota archaeon]